MVRRQRRVAAVQATLVGLAAVGLWGLGAMLIDRWLHVPGGVRRFTRPVALVLLAWTAWRVGRLLWADRFDTMRAARVAERLDPAWQERLSTLATHERLPAERRGSTAMLRALASGVEAELHERPPAARVTSGSLRPPGLALAGVVAAWLVAFAVPSLDAPRLLARQWRPGADLAPATSLRIELQPHAAAVEQGRSLSITADVDGGDESAVLWFGPDARHLSPVPMDRSYGRRFTTTLLALQEDFVYRVSAGDAASGMIAVRVLRRPGVTRLDVTLTPPDGGPAIMLEDSDGRLNLAGGTRVAVVFRVTEPLRSASVRVGDIDTPAVADADGRTWRASFVATADAAWTIELLGRRGTHGTGPAGMRVTVGGET
jgi:hypothetical protein